MMKPAKRPILTFFSIGLSLLKKKNKDIYPSY